MKSRLSLLTPIMRWFLAGMILANIASSMLFGLLALYIADVLGGSIQQVGLTFTLAAMVPLILQILGGWLSDTIGRLPTIAIGAVIASIGYVMMPFVPTWHWAAGALMLEYVSGSLVGPSFSAFIADQSSEEMRGRVFGLVNSIYAIVGVVGPPLGGLLAEQVGFRVTIGIAAVLYALTAVLRVWMALHFRERPGNQEARLPKLSELPPALWQLVLLVTSGGLLTWIFLVDGVRDISFRLAFELESLYFSDVGGLSYAQIGLLGGVFNAVRMVSMLPAGWFSDRFAERSVIASGFAFQVAGILVFLNADHFWWFALAWALFGLGAGVADPAYSALISKAVPEDKRGIAFGLFATSIGVISLPAPFIGAYLWERISPQAPFQITVVLIVVSLGIVLLKYPSRATPPAPAD